MFSRIMELIDKPAGYEVTAVGDKWVRVPDEDLAAGRRGMYWNLETSEIHHAEDIFRPVNSSKYLGSRLLKRKDE